jgi:Ca2+-binding EF-hand superfamily protein
MDVEYIEFSVLRNTLKVNDELMFISYLKNTHKDLSERSDKNKKLGISKLTFTDYFSLPIIISEKLFNSLDKDQNGFLNTKEFIEGMQKLYLGSFEDTTKAIFDIYDFDNDGFINGEDIKIIMSYLPLKFQNNKNEFNFQMESLCEIDEILNLTFKINNKLNLSEYLESILKIASDSYLQLICFLYNNVPFSEAIVSQNKLSQREIAITNSKSISIPSPKITIHFSPFEDYFPLITKLDKLDIEKKVFKKEEDYCEMIRMENAVIVNNKESFIKGVDSILKYGKSVYESPTKFLKSSTFPIIEFSLDNNYSKNSTSNTLNSSYRSNKPFLVPSNTIMYENMIFKITENKNFKHYWLVLQGKEIYYYKNNSKEKVNGMHNLVGSYIKEGPEVVINEYRFFSFTIIFPTKQRNYYVQDKAQYDEWIKCFKKAIGYYNFFDFYVMKEEIGIGKFGLVKLGIHKLTNQKVAIKTIKKSSMTPLDLELVKSEIDIMKLLKHPNVVRLLDHFENAEYVYIVMELFQGGDLANFISKNHTKLTEEKFSNIMYQIASGLQYLHQFGILHRDLKPENIMLADKSNNTVIKIMDFGLSKVLGPKERVADGYGTLAFVAPEVLLRNPYNKQIDIWSLGIMMYYGLSGTLPFDDESNIESKIAKNIVYNELKFPSNKWSGRTKEVIDLIKKCLIKEQDKRIKLNEFLEHDWIKKFVK